jgi:hypothetical protein
MTPAGRNRRDKGVSIGAASAGTSLRVRNRLASQPTVPVLSNSAETPNTTAPSPARSPATQALGTRTGRFGHHHESSEIMTAPASLITHNVPRRTAAHHPSRGEHIPVPVLAPSIC